MGRLTLQDRLRLILTPCWTDAFTYGPRAPKGLLVLNGLDGPLLNEIESTGTLTAPLADRLMAGLLDAIPLEPTRQGSQAVLSLLDIPTVGEGAVPYLVMQNLSLAPLSFIDNLLARKEPVSNK